MKNKNNIYLDLSKCSEEQQKHVFSLLPENIKDISSPPNICGNLCLIFSDKWIIINSSSFFGRTEISFTAFKEMLGSGEKLTLRQQFESEIKAKGAEFLFESNNQNYITWLENKINSNQ